MEADGGLYIGKGTAESKLAAFAEANTPVADTVPDIVRLVQENLG